MSSVAKIGALATVVAVVLGALCVGASADGNDGTIEVIEAGSLTSSVRTSLGFLYGAGSRPGGLGTPVGTVRSGLGSVSGNPAGLAYLPANGLLMDILPPFGMLASDFVDFRSIADDAIDEATSGFAAPRSGPAGPTFDAELGQKGGVVSGAVGFRAGRFVVGAAIEEPLSMALEMTNTELEAFGQTTKEEGNDIIDIQVRCMADAAADLAFKVSRTTLATASEIHPDVAVGLSLSRYRGVAELSGDLRADGIVSYGDLEYAFNDPSDPWDNELGMSARGSYEGNAYGWSIGASWRPTDLVTVDASYASVPRLTLNGSLKTVSNVMPGIAEGEFHPDQILDSQPTLTELEETTDDDPATLLLPSHAGLAVSMHAPFVLATLEYRRYNGSFGFEYQNTAEGVDVSDGFGLELDFGVVRLGGGVVRGTLMGDSIEGGSAGDDILIPLANLGLGIGLGENMRMDAMILALPLQVLRLSLGYEF